jgi:hypothetical protein
LLKYPSHRSTAKIWWLQFVWGRAGADFIRADFSGEVYVIGQPLIPRPGNQALHPRDLSLPGAAANQDHNSGVLTIGTQCQKVIAIARNKDCLMRLCPLEYLRIGGAHRQHLSEARNYMTAVAQPACQIIRHILIEEEDHARGSCI